MNITPEAEKIIEDIIKSERKDAVDVIIFFRGILKALNDKDLLKAQGLVPVEEVQAAYKNGAEVGWDASFWQREKKMHDLFNKDLTEPVEWRGPETYKSKTDFLENHLPPYKQ